MGAIVVEPIREDSIKVRRKVVFKDMNENWIEVSELSSREKAAFSAYKAEFIDKGVSPLPTKEY